MCVWLRNEKTYVVLGGRLRDQQNFSPQFSRRRERSSDDIGHSDNAGTAKADQRDVANRGKSLGASANALPFLRNFSPRLFRSETVANPDWNAFRQYRPKRLRMQDLRTEI